MKFTLKEPHLAYRGNLLWLPRDSIDPNDLARDLRLVVAGSHGKPSTIHTLFDRCGNHVRVPREYPVPAGVEVIDITPKHFMQTCIDEHMEPRDEQQAKAWEALQKTRSGVLHLACGIGKTALSLKWAVRNGGPILVIVYDTGTFSQWEAEVRRFTDYRGRIGVIQEGRMDWKYPIVFASITTLVKRPFLPVEARHWFQSIIFDECHHVAANVLKGTLPMFWGQRLGLTATPEREDGLERILFYHMGPVFYSDETQPLIPSIKFLVTGTTINMRSGHLRSRMLVDADENGEGGHWVMGDINLSKLHKHMGSLAARNALLLGEVEKARQKGRKILVLSHSVPHVEQLNRMRPTDSVAIHGGVSASVRGQAIREYPVVFATVGVAAEAMNAPDLDTVFFATPFQAKRILMQGMGRALRQMPGKKPPIIVILYDTEVSIAANLCRKLMTHLKAKGYEYDIVVPPKQRQTDEK